MRLHSPSPGLAPASPMVLTPPALALAWLAGGPVGACLALALVTLLVAAAERRMAAMLAAAGIAAGIGIEGLGVLPLAIGWAIAGRAGWRGWAMLPLGWAFAVVTLGVPFAPTPILGLWALAAAAPAGTPDCFALLAATLAGMGAWAAAASAIPRQDARERERRAALAALAFALLAPASAVVLVLPLTIAARARRSGLTLSIAAAGLLSLAGQPLAGTLALVAALLLSTRPSCGAANDNAPLRPLPYLP